MFTIVAQPKNVVLQSKALSSRKVLTSGSGWKAHWSFTAVLLRALAAFAV